MIEVAVGTGVGEAVGAAVGAVVFTGDVGAAVGAAVGAVGGAVGADVGRTVGADVRGSCVLPDGIDPAGRGVVTGSAGPESGTLDGDTVALPGAIGFVP